MSGPRTRLHVWPLESRLVPAGTLDPTFNGDGTVVQQIPGFIAARIEKVIAQTDGKVVAVGMVDPGTGQSSPIVLRYNADGSPDTGFDATGYNVVTVPGGRGQFFGAALQGNKVIAAGTASIGGVQEVILARLNTDGSLDSTFDGDGIVLTDWSPLDESAVAVAIQPDNRIVVGGTVQVQVGSNHQRMMVVRYFADGTPDASFGGTGKVEVDLGPSDGTATAVLVQPDGKIVAAGFSSSSGFNQSFSVVRLTPAGALDQTFDGDGIVKTTPNLTNFHAAAAAGLTIDGKIVLVGSSSLGANHRPAIAALRYNPDGSLDSTFGGTGYVVTDLPADTSGGVANGVAVQADGKVVAAGIAVVTGGYQSMLLRYNADGTLDDSFGQGGTTLMPGVVATDVDPTAQDQFFSVALQADGRIVAAGGSNAGTIQNITLARYTNDTLTAVDDTFTTPENTPLQVGRLGYKANDVMPGPIEPIGDLIAGPSHAAAFGWVPNGTFTYTPAAGFVGEDTITYRLRTTGVTSNTATIHITVTQPNRPPTAADDSYVYPFFAPLTVSAAQGVLANDTDPDGDTLHAVLVSQPAQGSVTLNDDGSFTFTYPDGASGPLTFTYQVTDGTAAGNVATVMLNPGNAPPVAVDDAYQLPTNGPLVVPAAGVLANDTDANGDTLTATLVTPPPVGTLTLNSDGSFTYDPPADLVGSVTFTYRANDGSADSGPATVTLTRGSSVSVNGSVLTVIGTGGPDVVRLQPVGTAIRIDRVTPEGVFRDVVRPAAGQRRFTLVVVSLGDGADRLDASTLAVPIQADGGAGDNTIRTGRRADTVVVGDGHNVIVTGAGNDTVTAGDGVNEISTGAGNDVIATGTGGSLIDAGAGNDLVTAAGGNNLIDGGAGRDVLLAGAGNDLIDGGTGNDLIVGGLGADRLEGSGGNDLLFDGTVALAHPTTDSLAAILAAYRPSSPAALADISARLAVTFDTGSADTLKGGSGTDWFWSNDAIDVLDITGTEPRNGM